MIAVYFYSNSAHCSKIPLEWYILLVGLRYAKCKGLGLSFFSIKGLGLSYEDETWERYNLACVINRLSERERIKLERKFGIGGSFSFVRSPVLMCVAYFLKLINIEYCAHY